MSKRAIICVHLWERPIIYAILTFRKSITKASMLLLDKLDSISIYSLNFCGWYCFYLFNGVIPNYFLFLNDACLITVSCISIWLIKSLRLRVSCRSWWEVLWQFKVLLSLKVFPQYSDLKSFFSNETDLEFSLISVSFAFECVNPSCYKPIGLFKCLELAVKLTIATLRVCLKPLSVLMKMFIDSKFFTAIFAVINFTPDQFMICNFSLRRISRHIFHKKTFPFQGRWLITVFTNEYVIWICIHYSVWININNI